MNFVLKVVIVFSLVQTAIFFYLTDIAPALPKNGAFRVEASE